MLRPFIFGVILIMYAEVNDSAGSEVVETAGVSIASGGGLALHQGLSGRASVRSTSILKSILAPDGQASPSDENESRQGGESDNGAQYVQHVHVCRLLAFVF
jgi:hypothetical protein